MDPHYHPFLVIALIAVLAPLASELPMRFRIPSVVLEIMCGILVGPQVLNWVRADGAVEILWGVGLCLLFLLAGIEIDFTRIRGKPLKLAVGGDGYYRSSSGSVPLFFSTRSAWSGHRCSLPWP
jgi:Kef-type K+ transport system membrane component KefB